MVQNIIVLLIVAAAVAFMVRKIYRTLNGREKCGCEGCCKCSLNGARKRVDCKTVKKPAKDADCCKKA